MLTNDKIILIVII